jgi:Ca2+-binding RTX toxin-like protein
MFINRRVLAAIGLAAVAVATTTTMFVSPAQAASTTGTANVISGTPGVKFQAGKGASNSLVITVSGRTVTLDDRVAIKAGKGCVAVKGDKTKVKCTTSRKPTSLVVSLGDKADSVTNKTSVEMYADGGAGRDTLRGGSSGDTLAGGADTDKLYGGNGIDDLDGGSGNDSLWGQAGGDYMYGGTGNDYLSSGTGNDSVAGGPGIDRLFGEDGHDNLYGGDGNDYLNGGNRSDKLWGGQGEDRIIGGNGDDTIMGDDSALDASGTPWRLSGDIIAGGSGNDIVVAGAGEDRVDGGTGDDVVYSEYLKDGSLAPVGRANSADKLVGGSQTNQDTALVLAGTSYSGFEKVWKAGGPNPTFSNGIRGRLNGLS